MSLPLVLIPGMMCDARLFGPQIEAFSANRPVQIAEIRSHDSIAELARTVLISAPLRFALAGLSMGGIVAMEIMAQAPERIAKLALLDTNPRAELPEVAAGRQPQMDRVAAGDLLAVMRDEMKPNYLADGPDRTSILDLCMKMALALGPEAFLRQSRALRDRPDQQDTLRQVAVPTLILCGREDRLCPVDRHELMRDLVPDSQLEIVDGAGHVPTLEQPKKTTDAMLRWLAA